MGKLKFSIELRYLSQNYINFKISKQEYLVTGVLKPTKCLQSFLTNVFLRSNNCIACVVFMNEHVKQVPMVPLVIIIMNAE